jgi:cytoskeletal protein RodZ
VDLEDELKRLFRDERLDVRVAADADKTIVAGARRVRRRRIVLVTTAGVLSVLAVGAGTMVLARGTGTSDSATPPTSLPITTSDSSTSLPDTPQTPSGLSAPPDVKPSVPPEPTSRTSSPTNSPARVTSTAAPITATVLGPTGYGPLRLGMTDTELQATGQVSAGPPSPAGSCSTYTINGQTGSRLEVSAKRGLVIIDPGPKIHTPESIAEGAAEDEVKAKYPDYDSQISPAIVRVPGNPAAWYYIYPGPDSGKIGAIVLVGSQSECAAK